MADSSSISHLLGQLLLPGHLVLDLSLERGDHWQIGSGLRVVEPWEPDGQPDRRLIRVSHAGVLYFRHPNLLWVESVARQYVAARGDRVLGVVTKKAGGEIWLVDVGCSNLATLAYTSFEGATKRNRPDVKVGDLVFGQLAVADRDIEPELVCIDDLGKSNGLGVIGRDGGVVVTCSLSLARRLLDKKNCLLLEHLGKVTPYEIAVGANGRIWVNAPSSQQIVIVSNAILAAEQLDSDQCKRMVRTLADNLTGFHT